MVLALTLYAYNGIAIVGQEWEKGRLRKEKRKKKKKERKKEKADKERKKKMKYTGGKITIAIDML